MMLLRNTGWFYYILPYLPYPGEGGVLQTADGQILTNEDGNPITSNLGQQQAKNNLGELTFLIVPTFQKVQFTQSFM